MAMEIFTGEGDIEVAIAAREESINKRSIDGSGLSAEQIGAVLFSDAELLAAGLQAKVAPFTERLRETIIGSSDGTPTELATIPVRNLD